MALLRAAPRSAVPLVSEAFVRRRCGTGHQVAEAESKAKVGSETWFARLCCGGGKDGTPSGSRFSVRRGPALRCAVASGARFHTPLPPTVWSCCCNVCADVMRSPSSVVVYAPQVCIEKCRMPVMMVVGVKRGWEDSRREGSVGTGNASLVLGSLACVACAQACTPFQFQSNRDGLLNRVSSPRKCWWSQSLMNDRVHSVVVVIHIDVACVNKPNHY